MREVKVNKISPRTNCGTVQLGDSGDTITIPAGATITNSGTQTGFGRNGTVNWQTSIKTGDFTSVSGEGYFVDTSSGEIDITLPSSPSAGDIVSIADYATNFGSNNAIFVRNGSNIEGSAANLTCNANGIAVTLVYADATKGWIVTETGNSTDANVTRFIAASGGTETESGDFKIHTFTGPGTFEVTCAGNSAGSNKVSFMVVAGGGGGASEESGGGGAGGYRESKSPTCSYTASPTAATGGLAVPVNTYPITVGAGGGTGPFPTSTGASGSPSIFSSITSAGGGGAGGCGGTAAAGGSGGGGGGSTSGATLAGGAGNTPPVSPSQGNAGGSGIARNPPTSPDEAGGGGGGAAAAGSNAPQPGSGGNGGNGVTSEINASPVTRAGGGGGGIGGRAGRPPGTAGGGNGGSGGGGAGAPHPSPATSGGAGQAGTANTGGGGGGSGGNAGPPAVGGAGGSGIVIIRYKFQ